MKIHCIATHLLLPIDESLLIFKDSDPRSKCDLQTRSPHPFHAMPETSFEFCLRLGADAPIDNSSKFTYLKRFLGKMTKYEFG
jgi:hypothetical protein